MTPVAMTIAGSDPSGGAGLQADLKTFHQHGVYGTSVVTLLTVQNTRTVLAVEILKPDFVMAQLDAVMVSKHGVPLLAPEATKALIDHLLPCAFLITPNLAEASRLAGIEVSDISTMEEAARRIGDMGPRHVLLKGGHLAGESTDLLWSNGQIHRFPGSRIDTLHTHGTGCVLSAAITARLARGESLLSAVEGAKKFVHKAIATHPGLGGGHGPINMFADV